MYVRVRLNGVITVHEGPKRDGDHAMLLVKRFDLAANAVELHLNSPKDFVQRLEVRVRWSVNSH